MGFPSPTGPFLLAGRRPTRGAPLVQRAGESARLPPRSPELAFPARPPPKEVVDRLVPARAGRHLLGSPALFWEQGPQAADRSFLAKRRQTRPALKAGSLAAGVASPEDRAGAAFAGKAQPGSACSCFGPATGFEGFLAKCSPEGLGEEVGVRFPPLPPNALKLLLPDVGALRSSSLPSNGKKALA